MARFGQVHHGTLGGLRVFKQEPASKLQAESGTPLTKTQIKPLMDQKDALLQVEQVNRDFYTTCAREEISKITKKHSFRSFVNQDRSPTSGTNIYDKARQKQSTSPVQNSSGLKYSLQEYASNID